MAAALVARHGSIHALTSFDETGKKGRGQKRHVAGYHQYVFRGRLGERRIQTTECSGSRDPIRHDRYARGRNRRRLARDDEEMRGELTEQ